MQDDTASHVPQGRLARKARLGGLLLVMVWLLTRLTAAAAIGFSAQPTTAATGLAPQREPSYLPDIYEIDDTQAQATLLPLNGPPQAHTFHVETDLDWFRVEGLVENRSYNVSTSKLVGEADTFMILYGQSGNIIATNDDINTVRCLVDPQFCASTITWTATSSGPYFLMVRTLTYPPPEDPVCPGYDIRFISLTTHLPMIIGPLSGPAPTTPTPTPLPTPTATPTRPAEVPTEVPVLLGRYPNGIAVNPDTHRVYVTSRDNDRLAMMDGLTNTFLKSVKVGDSPWGVAVNHLTNKVYVANFAGGTLSVQDGATLVNLDTLWVGPNPTFVEINENTNTIFTVTYGNEGLVVIDGASEEVVQIIGTGTRGSWGLAVNPNLNRVYVSGRNTGSITTLDGTNSWQPIAEQKIRAGGDDPCTPYELAFDPVTNLLYAACAHGSVDTALVYHATASGLTLLARLNIGAGGPDGGGGVVVNFATGNAFFTNSLDNTVSVVSGAANAVIATVPVGSDPFGVGVDIITGLVFVGNRDSNSISIFQEPTTP